MWVEFSDLTADNLQKIQRSFGIFCTSQILPSEKLETGWNFERIKSCVELLNSNSIFVYLENTLDT